MPPADEQERLRQTRAMQFRYAGLGLEFGGGIAGFVVLGWWLDSALGTAPTGLVTCAVVGSIGGIYHLIRRAYDIQRDFERASRPRPEGENEPRDDRPESPQT